MPTPFDYYSAAKFSRDDYNYIFRSKHAKHWNECDAKGLAVRVGMCAAFKAAGIETERAVTYADVFAEREKLPKWFVWNPLDDEEAYFSSVHFGDTPLDGLCMTVAGGSGRQVIGDDNPFSEAEIPAPADTLCIINLHSVRDRMLALFR